MTSIRVPKNSYVSRLLIAVCVALAACTRTDAADANLERASSVTGLRGTALAQPLVKPTFVLSRTDGTPYDFARETSGKITLLFFGYTHCPDVCPLHMANIAAVLKKMPWEERDAFRVVFVTTDPERDTPQRISEWLGGFDPAFIGLRGTAEQIDRAQESLGIVPATRGATDSKGEYLVGHAAQVFAFGRDDVARVVYPFGTRQDDWAHDLPRLLKGAAEKDTVSARALGNDKNLAVAPIVIAAAPDGASGALYLTVVNSGEQPDTLRAVSLIAGPIATMHVTNTDGGSASMQRVASLEIPARARLEMRPGGVHVMLEGGGVPLAPGSSAAVELHFARRGRITALGSVVTYAQLDSVLSLARAALETR
jgi:cytochrome oxidase Cu insertion factor (SCO1/SenC/PrrC family)/copper(I)-binding protein